MLDNTYSPGDLSGFCALVEFFVIVTFYMDANSRLGQLSAAARVW